MATADEAVSILNGIVNSVNAFGQMVVHLQTSQAALVDQHAAVVARLAEVEARRDGQRKGLVDTRHLAPDVFTGDRAGQSWRDWNYRLKAFVQAKVPTLRHALDLAERSGEAITAARLPEFGVQEEDDNDLRTLLALKTKDGAHTVIRQNEWAPGLEQYRLLARHYEPDTEVRDLDDLRVILQPGVAASMTDFASKFPAWKAAYQTRVNRVGPGAVLGDSVRRTIWISMLPTKEREDIQRNRHLWTTAEDLERHLLQLIQDRTAGPAPMIFNIDDGDDIESVIEDETGDTVLYRVEVKNGKKTRTRIGARPGGGKPGDRLCYRCGRPGHIGKDCRAKSHKDGGPVRMPQGARGRSGAGAVEEEDGEDAGEQDELIAIGGLDLCAVDNPEVISLEELLPAPRAQPAAAAAAATTDDGGSTQQRAPTVTVAGLLEGLARLQLALAAVTAATPPPQPDADVAKTLRFQKGEMLPNFLRERVPATADIWDKAVEIPVPDDDDDDLRTDDGIPEVKKGELLVDFEDRRGPPQRESKIRPKTDQNTKLNKDKVVGASPMQPPGRYGGRWKESFWRPPSLAGCCPEVLKLRDEPLHDVDACAVDAPAVMGRRLKNDITVDSGAARSVMNPADVPEYPLMTSEGQRKGQHFVGAGGERMPNLGQKTVPLMTMDGQGKAATFQAAQVRKPLLAVSASCDAGQLVIFDNDISCMLERDSPEGREIRRLARQCVAKTTFERKGGVYTMPAFVVPPEKLKKEDRQRFQITSAPGAMDCSSCDVNGCCTPGFPRQGQ